MPTVTVARIAEVSKRLTDTVIDTTALSMLPAEEQDKRLADGCGWTCGLLEDWLASEVWRGMCPSGDQPIDFLQHQKSFDDLMVPLKDVLDRASQNGMNVPPKYVDQTRKALRAAALLFQEAQEAEVRIIVLKEEVCKLARQLRDRNATREERAEARMRARSLLKIIFGTLLPSLVIAMAGVSPSVVANNFAQWNQIFNGVAIGAIADVPIRAILDRPNRVIEDRPITNIADRGNRDEPEPGSAIDRWPKGPDDRPGAPKEISRGDVVRRSTARTPGVTRERRGSGSGRSAPSR
jgi:hypothetical protein